MRTLIVISSLMGYGKFTLTIPLLLLLKLCHAPLYRFETGWVHLVEDYMTQVLPALLLVLSVKALLKFLHRIRVYL